MHHSNLSLPNLCCHVAFSLSGSKFCFCNKDTSHWVRAHPNPAWLHLNLITPPKIWVANKMTLAGTQGEDIFLGDTSQLKRTTYYTLTISGITNGLEKAHLQSHFLNMWCSLRIKANRPLQRGQPSLGWQVGLSISTAHIPPKLSQYALLPFPFCKPTLKHTINTENEEKPPQKDIYWKL